MCSVFKHFRLIFKAGKGSQSTTEISSKEGWKKHTLFGRSYGGVPRALTKKIYPVLFLHFWGKEVLARPE
jgi:hypothetical protein